MHSCMCVCVAVHSRLLRRWRRWIHRPVGGKEDEVPVVEEVEEVDGEVDTPAGWLVESKEDEVPVVHLFLL